MAKRHPVLTAFGLNVRKQREARGLTQESLAEKADLDQTYISGIERGVASILKNFAAVIFQEFRSRYSQLFRQVDRPTLVRDEILRQRGLRKVALQPLAEHHAESLIERDEAVVKGSIVERRKAQAVSRVQTLTRKIPPRLDMTGDQKTRHGNSRNAATNAIGVQDSLSEELLSASNPNRRLSFCWSSRRRITYRPLQPYLVASKEIYFFVVVLCKQVVEQLLALGTEACHVGLKLVPHNHVLLRGTSEPFDAACPLHGVKRREIAELHCKTVRRPPHLPSDLDNDGIAVMKFPERKLAIEVQRDQQVLARPHHSRSFCHADRLPETAAIAKRENAYSVWQTWPGASAEL